MGLSGDERKFLLRIKERGPQERFAETIRFGSDLQADRSQLEDLKARGYLKIAHTSPMYQDLIRFELTDAAKDVLRLELQNSEAFSKGMASGKQMFGNAVNRLRAKLLDQRVPTVANRLHKLFSKRAYLTDEEKALLTEMKEALSFDGDAPAQGPFQITINSKTVTVPKNVVSYTELVEAAGLKCNPSMVVTQRNKHQGQRAFTLTYGHTVVLEPGWETTVNAHHTESA
jgi:hypothetical protein